MRALIGLPACACCECVMNDYSHTAKPKHRTSQSAVGQGWGWGWAPCSPCSSKLFSSDGPQMMVGGHWVGEHWVGFGPCTSARMPPQAFELRLILDTPACASPRISSVQLSKKDIIVLSSFSQRTHTYSTVQHSSRLHRYDHLTVRRRVMQKTNNS